MSMVLVLSSLLATATPSAAQPADASAPAPATTAVAEATQPKPKPKLICHTEEVLGSRLAGKKVCYTEEQEKEMSRQGRDEAARAQAFSHMGH